MKFSKLYFTKTSFGLGFFFNYLKIASETVNPTSIKAYKKVLARIQSRKYTPYYKIGHVFVPDGDTSVTN